MGTVTGPAVAPLGPLAALPPPPPPPPGTGNFPTVTVQAQFTPGIWTDISAYAFSGSISRASTRQQGPLITYQAGTLALLLDNTGGRFDPDNLSGPYVATSVTRVVSFQAGSGTWTAPAGIASTMKVEGWGAGGGAGGPGGTGGGGGEYAAEPAVTVFAGQTFSYTAGAPGTGGTSGVNGTPGGATSFGPVTAHGGGAGLSLGVGTGQGGTGSSNTTHHDGGDGGLGNTIGGGGGGGGSGGTGSAGHGGHAASGTIGGGGGTAVTGGGPGGNGATLSGGGHPGSTPFQGPGGGGGAASAGPGAAGGAGAAGQITLTYVVNGTVTQITPMVPIQVTATYGATTYPLFTGYADSWADTTAPDAGPYYAEVTLSATDAFKVLAGITLPTAAAAGAGEDTGTRIHRILNAARWPAGQRNIDTGDTLLQATTFGADALSLMQLASDSEIGSLYADGAGNVVFRHRKALLQDTRSASPQGVFGDLPGTVHSAGTEIFCDLPARANDDTTLANDVQAQRVGGALQQVTDQSSVSKFLYPRSYARSDLIVLDDATAAQWAGWVLYVSSGGENRFDALSIDPTGGPDATYPQALVDAGWSNALGRDIGDRIQVWRRPPNAGTVTKDCFVTGITHVFDARGNQWETTWSLSSADKYGSFFTIGDPILGRIGLNAIAW